MILLIYNLPRENAPTIMDHVNAFVKYSEFKVISLNIAKGFPRKLPEIKWSAIIIHYSAYFWSWGQKSPKLRYPQSFDVQFFNYLKLAFDIPKVMFFQDEMDNVQERITLINHLKPKIIYSLLDPKYFDSVYKLNSKTTNVKNTLTGYISDDLILKNLKYYKPISERTVDVGYRARSLSFHYGRGSFEKAEIAYLFTKAAKATGIKIDISTREVDRIYGDDWYRFIANCKFMLGVMSGTSIFDITGEVRDKTDNYIKKHPNPSFAEVEEAVLLPYENNINYRTISPRLFECVALRVCMILYRDDYQGILKAGEHYIPLEKDFSNIDTVLNQMKDENLVNRIIENAYHDIITSGKWHYRKFILKFDKDLKDLGCNPSLNRDEVKLVESTLNKDISIRLFVVWLKSWRSRSFLGRTLLKKFAIWLGLIN